MRKLLAIIGVTLLAFLGIAGTASAATDDDRFEECAAALDEGFFALTDHLDDVEFDQLLYDIDDLFTKLDMGLISEEEFLAGLDELLPGLADLLLDFFDCLGADEPVEPPIGKKKPAAVPTSIPAGHDAPASNGAATVTLVGLGVAAVSGLLVLRRRVLN